MDGLQTFRAMRALEPDLRVVVSSGLVRDQLVQRVLAEGAAGFVGKPYDLRWLAATVARALGRV
jgi:CheY-like chemotaxis protein